MSVFRKFRLCPLTASFFAGIVCLVAPGGRFRGEDPVLDPTTPEDRCIFLEALHFPRVRSTVYPHRVWRTSPPKILILSLAPGFIEPQTSDNGNKRLPQFSTDQSHKPILSTSSFFSSCSHLPPPPVELGSHIQGSIPHLSKGFFC